jgi:hypothetical protein
MPFVRVHVGKVNVEPVGLNVVKVPSLARRKPYRLLWTW